MDDGGFASVSGYVLDGLPQRSLAAGIAVHLTKPIGISALLAALAGETGGERSA